MVTAVSIKDIVLDSAKEVFETMVFMSLEETEEAFDPAEITLLGNITFMGGIEGSLCICCGMKCSQTIAANMLCMDDPEEVADEDISDAFGEVANMVLGSIKTRLQDDVSDMHISIPSVIQGRELATRPNDGMVTVPVIVKLAEEHLISFTLIYREAASNN